MGKKINVRFSSQRRTCNSNIAQDAGEKEWIHTGPVAHSGGALDPGALCPSQGLGLMSTFWKYLWGTTLPRGSPSWEGPFLSLLETPLRACTLASRGLLLPTSALYIHSLKDHVAASGAGSEPA